MDVDHSQRGQTIVRERPLLLPGLGLLFVVVGVVALLSNAFSGLWDPNAVFGACASIAMGGGLFLYTARRCEYHFDRFGRELHWVQRGLFGTREGWIPFAHIERVVLQRGPDAEDELYRVVLYTRDGELPLSRGFTWQAAKQRAAKDAIEVALRA
jgi:hypothetical protein